MPRPWSEGVSIMAGIERPGADSGLTLLWLLMAAIALVLLVYGFALLVVIEFIYRHLIAAPAAWLLARLGGLAWRS
jgi:hypothetical protein